MKISTPRCPQKQLRFWPQAISGMPQTRNHFGELAEELSASISGGIMLRTDGTADYCPDLSHGGNKYSECKSVGRSGHAIIYEGRRNKDRHFVRSGHRLYYWFWRHNLKGEGIADVEELKRQWCSAVAYGVLVSFSAVDALLKDRRLKVLNTALTVSGKRLGYGQKSKGYGEGRTLLMSTLIGRCDKTVVIPHVTVGGATMNWLTIHTMRSAEFLCK